MRARWLVGLGIGATLIATIGFVACASGPSSDPQPTRPAAATTSGSAPVTPASTTTPAGATPDDAGADVDLASAIEKARRCEAPRSAIRNHPDGGTVFNNAMFSEDAGSIDRMQDVIEAIAGRADAFRCCFDHWLSANEAGELRVMLQVAIDPNGTVESASLDPARSSGGDAILSGCLAAVARDIAFPPSPSGSPTLVEYPFDVAQP